MCVEVHINNLPAALVAATAHAMTKMVKRNFILMVLLLFGLVSVKDT